MQLWVSYLATFICRAQVLQQRGRTRLVALVQCGIHLVQQQQPRAPARLRRLCAPQTSRQ